MEVSIIVPFTRVKKVRQTVDSLLKEKTSYSYEIIIIGERKKFTGSFPNIVKKVRSNKKLLPGQARNLGIKSAQGKYLLFLDDDCLVSEDWVEKNVNFLKSKKKIGAVGGRIKGKSQKYFALCTDYTNFWRQQGNSLRKVNQLYTASLGVKKKAFLKVGGFDKKAKIGEDVDFINKLGKNGYLSYYTPKIIVLHDHQRDTLKKFLKYMYNNGLFTGLYILKTQQRNVAVKFFLPIFQRAYFFFVVPMALFYTGANLYLNLFSNWEMIFLLPFIFLGYLVYHFGIAVKLRREV